MKDKGYCGIGVENIKTKFNYWTLFRTAQILDVDFLFVIGKRFEPGVPDTMKSFKNIPVFNYTDFSDFNDHRPYNCRLIGIELTKEALEVSSYNHPKQACYLLGAEDNGLTKMALNNCQDVIKLYGDRSMNVSVAGSIILYDRYVKNLNNLK